MECNDMTRMRTKKFATREQFIDELSEAIKKKLNLNLGKRLNYSHLEFARQKSIKAALVMKFLINSYFKSFEF